ncbi:hypothetical protein [Pseudoalteromonas spongiae]|uniref:hypothetical protein n=1 Tax=Pseudoalteromonas spongiae TaxID=298657 RepID=UPI00110A9E49|nr:hypothetical protein [Pseudoalteromonas spongiae]TMO84237.1 hypothetical protein CWC15_11575 [Pseudoalteromonas spongiae]
MRTSAIDMRITKAYVLVMDDNTMRTKIPSVYRYLATSVLILFSFFCQSETSVSDNSHTTCSAKNIGFSAEPNSLTANSLEGFYGYSDLFYLPNSPSRKVVLVSNGQKFQTGQGMLDDIEAMVSVEKYKNHCENIEIIIVRARYFESGLELIRELAYLYVNTHTTPFRYIGTYDFVSGDDNEYQMLMQNTALLPDDFKDIFSTLELTLKNSALQLRITNFLNTKTTVKVYPIK